jgi:sulfur carrier protein
MTVTVNGSPLRVPPGESVADLLRRLSLASPRVAVERNKEIVPRAQHAATPLEEGDVLEVVELVGGG